ncbi:MULTISPECIES: VanZ family protein [unclassified Bacillus (in: firmicutes)]|uniref:VanZ family protein n=1 Tax=unclassified Bacillus (in: firmicutes) TaxID=185979 RepID=UPI0008E4935D|nr:MULTISPECIES: VanZ family protein [unclassified Bacillus (in: firmicutes)]SFJ68783.1 VanZ like family protein [Bacillus sp. 71mf]SFT20722.1 VanZ like family protein [Bacillus sp. 103mf]
MNRKWLFWIPVLVWMGVIFYSSSQPYQQQDMRPDIMKYVNAEFVKEHFSWVSIDYGGGTPISIVNKGVDGFIEFFIRKGAHFTVFGILGALSYFALLRCVFNRKQVFWLSLLLVAMYAGMDEIHQSFTGDRTPMWQDSVLDTCGGITGILISRFVWKRKRS